MEYSREGLENLLTNDEEILWRGKPKKMPYCLGKYIKQIPIAIIWLMFDLIFIFVGLTAGGAMLIFILVFMAFHLLPVWKILVDFFTAKARWKNEDYIVTNKRILIQSGLIGVDYNTIYYKDITDVRLDVGLIESLYSVGNIIISMQRNTLVGNVSKNNNIFGTNIIAIENPKEVYKKIQKIIMDMQTDIYYPNALRPEENAGYKTRYNGSN